MAYSNYIVTLRCKLYTSLYHIERGKIVSTGLVCTDTLSYALYNYITDIQKKKNPPIAY